MASPPASVAPGAQQAIDVLVRFGELLSGAAEPAQVMTLLARTAVEQLGASGALVVVIDEKGNARIGAREGVAADLDGFPGDDADAFGPELGDALLARYPDADARALQAVTIPLASGGGVFGSIVMLFPREAQLEAPQLAVARGLVAVAASGLNLAARYAELNRSYAALRASREVLERSQKLRALGEMAAGVSHDLKNIINPLSLHLQFLKRTCRDDEDAQQSVREMQGILKRGLETIERLRDFSRQQPALKVEVVELDKIAHEAIEICKPRLRTRHDVHYKLVEELGASPPVKIKAGEAVAAIVNLIVNAVDAMPGGGTITVTTGAGAEEGRGTGFVRVADDGPGMPPEIEQRVFEPFFTTKGQEGTGLGLAMVYAFVQRHYGRIHLDTAPGRGAAFTISFPAAAV